jgi:pimeloyl-ACP methyl ester carboxylesterase
MLYLHGFDSSPDGVKSRFFAEHIQQLVIPDMSCFVSFFDRLIMAEAQNASVIIGASLGGYIASLVASKNPVKALVLLAPAFNFLEEPGEFSQCPKIECPSLVFIGDQDQVVSIDLVKRFCLQNNSELVVIPGGDHRLHEFLPEIWDRVQKFLAELNLPFA